MKRRSQFEQVGRIRSTMRCFGNVKRRRQLSLCRRLGKAFNCKDPYAEQNVLLFSFTDPSRPVSATSALAALESADLVRKWGKSEL